MTYKLEDYIDKFKSYTGKSQIETDLFFETLVNRLNQHDYNFNSAINAYVELSDQTNDEKELNKLRLEFIHELAGNYHMSNLLLLLGIIEEEQSEEDKNANDDENEVDKLVNLLCGLQESINKLEDEVEELKNTGSGAKLFELITKNLKTIGK